MTYIYVVNILLIRIIKFHRKIIKNKKDKRHDEGNERLKGN